MRNKKNGSERAEPFFVKNHLILEGCLTGIFIFDT